MARKPTRKTNSPKRGPDEPVNTSVEGERRAADRRAGRIAWMLALAAGLVGGFSFEPLNLRFLFPDVPLASAGLYLRVLAPLVPLGFFLAARCSPSPRGAFFRLLVGGWLYHLIALNWLLTPGRFFIVVTFGMLFVFFYFGFFVAVGGWGLRRWFTHLNLLTAFAVFASLWVLGEWVRSLSELAVPLAYLGHAWAPWPWAIQWAEFAGELGVTAQLLLVAWALLALSQRFGFPARFSEFDRAESSSPSPSYRTPAIVLITLLVLVGSGLRYRAWSAKIDGATEAEKLRVGMLQTNINQQEKLDSYSSPDYDLQRKLGAEHFKLHQELVAKVPPGIDLLVMPEATFPSIMFSIDPYRQRRVEDAAAQDKMLLVPIAETLSYFELIPFITAIVPVESFNSGKEAVIFETHGRKFGSLICFETCFASHSRKLVIEGAEFLAAMTNDAWYGWSSGAANHHHLSYLRAVETRRPLIHCTNTGVSSLIDAAGRRTAGLPFMVRDVLSGEIAPQTVTTFFVRWGNTWLIAACFIWLAWAMVRLRRPYSSSAESRT